MQSIGFRVLRRAASSIDESTLQQFHHVGAAQIGDCMGRLYGAVGLLPFHRTPARLVGRALTVKVRPGDNLFIHKALGMAQEGDVLVVDGGGDLRSALVGELMREQAIRLKIAGWVIDGAIRDVDSFKAGGFPCYARGVSHVGPLKEGPGEVNVPVSVGGQVVHPGDVVVGDADGVIFVPAALAAEVLALALAKRDAEDASLQRIRRDGYQPKPWVDAAIAQKTGVAA